MTKKNRLTNEKLNKLFESPFNLVNYAIKQAKIKIAKKDVRSSNVAIEALNALYHDGVRPEFADKGTSIVPPSEKKRDSVSHEKRKDMSNYVWSDVK